MATTQRVICSIDSTIMAEVRQTPEGPLYKGLGPTVDYEDTAFLKTQGFEAPRSMPVDSSIEVLVASTEADEYDPNHREELPAWCPKCKEWRWVSLVRLRSGEAKILSP